MIINSARFETSSPSVEKCPDTQRHEYAFIGRSNVGKSSLINMLTGRNGLAKTSAMPGKTMLINHFVVNEQWTIVDLPGYGFARRGKESRDELRKMIEDYILYRPQMTNLFVLIDSRHEPQKIDLEFFDWLGEHGIPFSIIFTKMDKQGPEAGRQKVAAYCSQLLERWEELPPVFTSSSLKGKGRDEILDYIEQLNRLPLGGNDDEAQTTDGE
ncbi:MAG: YihA family ribosome biogenesis GTP-binding protein [Bacteroides sp.]|nr:YihA family ribosome biogenesis GTP-binding protein [Bacteroides sp.]MBD5378026.1 YihA family ribosome biogenesis GTP-binding protein [Bacteroides sp.]